MVSETEFFPLLLTLVMVLFLAAGTVTLATLQ
jgi:hypothetical protein